MKRIAVQLTWTPDRSILVGHLAESERRVYFEYEPAFPQSGLQLSPFKLPLRPGLFEHTDRAFGPLPGVFDDSLPDGWGLLLMDRLFRRQGLDPASMSPLDRLLYLGTRTMGALTYHPPQSMEPDQSPLDIEEIARNAQAIHSGQATEVLPALARAGGSPGGARPKILVGLCGDQVISGEDNLPAGFEHWMVKFAAASDARDAGAIEYAYSLMARAAGIEMPPTRLIEGGGKQAWFAVQRFDRAPGNRRRHMHTFANLIHANYRIPSTDYADLLKVTAVLTRKDADVLRVFRRMVFNVAARNRDDHSKNFAFLMNELGEWSLAPAYDLVFSAGPGGEHTMTIAGEGLRPTREHILRLAGQFSIKPASANVAIDEVNQAIGQWPALAEEAGCTKSSIRTIATAMQRL